MAVAQADEVTGHGVDGGGARVRKPLLKPGRRLPEILQEEVVQAGREVRAHLHAHVGHTPATPHASTNSHLAGKCTETLLASAACPKTKPNKNGAISKDHHARLLSNRLGMESTVKKQTLMCRGKPTVG